MPIIKNVQSSLELGKYTGSVFIDLQKAFHTEDHDILLKQLERYGARGIPNRWYLFQLETIQPVLVKFLKFQS